MVRNYKEVLYDNETLETERLILRKFRKNDVADILEYGSDPETLKYLDWEGIETEGEAMESIVDYYWSNPGVYAICPKEEEKCIGCIDLRMDPDHEKAVPGYVLNRDYWGCGYMSEALDAVMALCFEKLELNRVESCYYAGNEGSGRVMEKCGMKFEGVSKQGRKIKGIFQDVVNYGVTKEDWISHKKSKIPLKT